MTIKVLRPHLSLGFVTLAFDILVILLGWPVFGNVDSVLYGLSTVTINSIGMDKIMYGIGSSKLVIIVTERGPQVAERLMAVSNRGTTSINAVGAYTNREKQVLLCACAKSEAFRVRQAAHAVDPSAFIMITESSEIYGEGFTDPENTTTFL